MKKLIILILIFSIGCNKYYINEKYLKKNQVIIENLHHKKIKKELFLNECQEKNIKLFENDFNDLIKKIYKIKYLKESNFKMPLYNENLYYYLVDMDPLFIYFVYVDFESRKYYILNSSDIKETNCVLNHLYINKLKNLDIQEKEKFVEKIILILGFPYLEIIVNSIFDIFTSNNKKMYDENDKIIFNKYHNILKGIEIKQFKDYDYFHLFTYSQRFFSHNLYEYDIKIYKNGKIYISKKLLEKNIGNK